MKDFLSERSQLSIEFVLLAGGVIVAAITFFAIKNTVSSFADVTSDFVEMERNKSITRVTR